MLENFYSYKIDGMTANPLRACLTSPRARLGGIFSALTALKILAIRQDCCGFLPCRAKNLSRQSAHAEILNRLLNFTVS